MSLSKRIIIIITFGLIAVIGTTAAMSYFFTTALLEESVSNQQLRLVQQTMGKVDWLLFQQYNQIQTIARDESIKEFFQEKQKSADIARRIKELGSITGPWESISIIDTQGTIIASTGSQDAGTHITAYPQNAMAFLKVLQDEKVYVSDTTFSQQTNNPVIIFAAPIREAQNSQSNIIGIVIAHLPWGTVEDILSNVSGEDGPYVSLINKSGNVIGTFRGRQESHRFSAYTVNKEVLQAVLSGKSGSNLMRDTKNNAVLLSYFPQKGYKEYKGSGWGMILETPFSIAFASVSESAYRITASTGLIMLLLAIVIFFVLHKYFMHPLFSLTETARDIVHGDLHKRVYVSSKDEIGELGEILNEMTEHLTSSHFALQEKNEALKKSLQEVKENRQEIGYIKKAMLHIVDNLRSYKHQFEGIRQTVDSIIENVNEGIVITDHQGMIIHANQSARYLFGDSLTDAVNKSLAKTIPFTNSHGEQVPPDEHVLYQAFSSIKTARADYSYQFNGGSLDLSVTVVPIIIEDKPAGSVVIMKKR